LAQAQPAARGPPARDPSVRPAADSQIELRLALPVCDFAPNFHSVQVGPEGNGGFGSAPTMTRLQRTPCNASATSTARLVQRSNSSHEARLGCHFAEAQAGSRTPGRVRWPASPGRPRQAQAIASEPPADRPSTARFYQYSSTWSVPILRPRSLVKPRASAHPITVSIMPGLPHKKRSKLSGVTARPVSFSMTCEAMTFWR